MTTPAGPHYVSLQFADVNAMATTPIQNLSSATNNVLSTGSAYPNVPAPAAADGALPPVYSKSGIIGYVEAEKIAGRPPYFRLDPTSLAAITAVVNTTYPYGNPTGALNTVIAAQSALEYDLASGNPFAAPPSTAVPVYNSNLPGRWIRLNIDDAIAPIP